MSGLQQKKSWSNFLMTGVLILLAQFGAQSQDAQKSADYDTKISRIVHSTDDKERLAIFKSILNDITSHEDRYQVLAKIVRKMTESFKANPEAMPMYQGDMSFFGYVAGLSYYPTVQTGRSSNLLWKDTTTLLASFEEFRMLYGKEVAQDKIESSYLTHHIGKIAYLVIGEALQKDFPKLDYWAIRRKLMESVYSSFDQSYPKNLGVQGAQAAIQTMEVSKNYQLELINIYKNSISNLLDVATKQGSSEVRLFALKQLTHWVKYAEMGDNYKTKLRETSRTDRNPKIRNSARLVLMNAI